LLYPSFHIYALETTRMDPPARPLPSLRRSRKSCARPRKEKKPKNLLPSLLPYSAPPLASFFARLRREHSIEENVVIMEDSALTPFRDKRQRSRRSLLDRWDSLSSLDSSSDSLPSRPKRRSSATKVEDSTD